MKPKIFVLAASIALMILTVGAYMMFFATPIVAASITLQVNPAISLTLSDRNTVISVEGLDEQGRALLVGLNLEGKEVQEALRIVVGALREADLLTAERRIFVAVKPVGDSLDDVDVETLAETVGEVLDGYLTEHGLQAKVVSAAITTELAGVVQEYNLYPDDYVDLVEKVGSSATMRILDMQNKLDLDPALFEDEFGTMAASLIDMIDAGITEENALSILKSSLAADPTLEELTTITAAFIDLHDIGASQADIMAILKLLEEQIAAGIERNLVLEEFSTIVAAKIDMMDAGLSSSEALAVLKTAMTADPKLEELTTITAAMIDLVDEGLSKGEALLRIQRAIKADPTLDNFDDLLEDPELTDEPVNEPVDEPVDEEDEQKDEAAVSGETQADNASGAEEDIESEVPNNDVKEETGEGADTDSSKPDANQKPDENTDDNAVGD